MSQESTNPRPLSSDPPTSQLCSLSRLDSVFAPIVYTACLVINCPGDNFDESIYQAAVEKAIDKNRIFAGRVQKEKINDLLQLLVPLGELPKDYKLCNFSCQTIDKFINYPQLNSSAHELITMPDLTYFRASNTPTNVSEFIEKDLPIFTFLVTKLRNIVCIGITFTHVFVDGGGLGILLELISQELKNPSGELKTIPLHPENLLEMRYKKLSSSEEIREMQQGFPFFRKLNYMNIGKTLINWTWEYIWHRSSAQILYVGRDLLANMIAEAKAEVTATGSKYFISTNDILIAWLLKTIYTAESSNSNSLSLISISTPRSDFGLETYPHNSLSLVQLPSPSPAQLLSNPISKTALTFREALQTARVPSILDQNFVRIYNCLGSSVLAIEIGVDNWTFNNQSISSLFSTDWSKCLKRVEEGEEQIRVVGFVYEKEDFMQNFISIVEIGKEGLFIKGNLRKKRWEAIRSEVQRLKVVDEGK